MPKRKAQARTRASHSRNQSGKSRPANPAPITSVKSGTEKSSGGPNTVCRRHGSEQPKPVAIHPNAQRTPMNNNVPSNADTNDQRPDSVNCDTNPTIEAAHEYFELFLEFFGLFSRFLGLFQQSVKRSVGLRRRSREGDSEDQCPEQTKHEG